MESCGDSKDGFTRQEWDFDSVPDHELSACCLWEHGRESLTLERSALRHIEMIEEMRQQKRRPRAVADKAYEAFLEAYWNSDEGYMELYETIRCHGGAGAVCWQGLAVEVRWKLVRQHGSHLVSAPLRVAYRGELEDLWERNLAVWKPAREAPDYDRHDDSMAYEASDHLVEPPGHGGESHGDTVAAFTVDFRKFNNRQIMECLRVWLEANRPEGCPEPTERGRKLRDVRVALDRLGMMRLLHRHTLRMMRTKCPETVRAFAGYDWYKERKRAGQMFRKLFPFLPKDEKPLSWPTRGGRSR